MKESKITLWGAWCLTGIAVGFLIYIWAFRWDVNGLPIPMGKQLISTLYGIGFLLGALVMYLEAKALRRRGR